METEPGGFHVTLVVTGIAPVLGAPSSGGRQAWAHSGSSSVFLFRGAWAAENYISQTPLREGLRMKIMFHTQRGSWNGRERNPLLAGSGTRSRGPLTFADFLKSGRPPTLVVRP